MAGVELELLKKFGRHAWGLAWWLVAVQVATTAAGMVAMQFIPKKYESGTTIRVERSQLINPLVRGLAVSSESEERIRSIREEILSRDYFEKIITRLALERPNTPPSEHEGRVQRMIKNTTLTTRQRDTFQISYRGEDPKEVRDVTNLLAGIFIEDSLSNKAGEAGSAVDFLQGQLGVYRGKLEEAEASLRRFEEKNVDLLPSNRAAYLSRADQIRVSLVELQNNLRQAKIQRDLLRQQTTPAESVPGSAASPATVMVVNPLQGLIREKEAQLRRLLVDYSETYPDVIALRAEIDGMRREFDRQPTVPAGQAASARQPSVQDALTIGQLQQIEMQIGALSTREQQMNQDLARFERRVQGIPEVEQELARLKRDYDVNNDIYNSILRRLEEAKVSRELEDSKKGEVFRILQGAVLPLSPVSPNKLATVMLGVAAGLGLNALLIFVLAQHDTSIQSSAEAHKLLNLKVLAGIPWYEPPKARSRRVAKAVALTIAGLVYTGGVAAFLFLDTVASLLRMGG